MDPCHLVHFTNKDIRLFWIFTESRRPTWLVKVRRESQQVQYFSITCWYRQLDEQKTDVHGTVSDGSRIHPAIRLWTRSEMVVSDIE